MCGGLRFELESVLRGISGDDDGGQNHRHVVSRFAREQSGLRGQLPEVVHLAGSVDGLAPDMSRNIKAYLKSTGYGRKRPR